VTDCSRAGNTLPQMSIIVPVHNNAQDLGECLDVLHRACTDQCEIIVVDDASTDDSREQASRRGVQILPMPQQSGPAAARNWGACRARGDLLFFVDSDVLVREDAVARVIETFRNRPEIAAVFGSYDSCPRAPGAISQYRNLLHHFVHQSGNQEASTFWAGCGSIRREVFEKIGGFDAHRYPHPSIEDIELGNRLRQRGYRILLDKELRATHLKRWTLASVIYTDIFRRAVPWSRLILERRRIAGDLNLQRAQRLSVALTAVIVICLVIWPLLPAAPLFSMVALTAVILLNWNFLAFLCRQRDVAFAAQCLPLLLLHYLCGGIGFVYAWTRFHLDGATTNALAREKLSP
jgi:GT2 family glycosyltransferase